MATSVSQIQTRSSEPVDGSPEDKSLVLLFQAGTSEAYDEIFERYRPLAERICYRILGDREDAQEAVQETMLRVYRGLGTFNGRYQLQAWVARIATNVSLDMVRARSRRPQRDPATPDISDDHVLVVALVEDASEAVERVLDREEIREILSTIPDHHRTALMLREFEGRSHEEIGEALGVTPHQAKALIHRAKRSFRRAWDQSGDRRGVAALAPIFLLPFKLPGFLRKLWQPAHEALAGASTTAQQVAVQATAAPAATQGAVSLADKVTAAAITVIVAGTVSVGAVAIRDQRQPTKAAAAVTASPAPAPPVQVLNTPPARSRPVIKPEHKPHHKPDHTQGDQSEHQPVPVGTPTESPGTSPSPGPDPSPSPGPSTPPIGPAPAWGLTFTAGGSGSGSCGDCTAPTLVSSNVTGTAGEDVSISQVAQGTATNVAGHPTLNLFLEYWGSASGTTGQLQYDFKLGGQQGWFSYAGVATLSSSGPTDDGGYSYTFTGGYQLTDGAGDAGMPIGGSLQVTLRFWADGTSLYSTDVALYEV